VIRWLATPSRMARKREVIPHLRCDSETGGHGLRQPGSLSSMHFYERITLGRRLSIERCAYPEQVVTGQTISAHGTMWVVDRVEPGTPDRPLPRLLCLDGNAVAGTGSWT
jgi:hypothetical protein